MYKLCANAPVFFWSTFGSHFFLHQDFEILRTLQNLEVRMLEVLLPIQGLLTGLDERLEEGNGDGRKGRKEGICIWQVEEVIVNTVLVVLGTFDTSLWIIVRTGRPAQATEISFVPLRWFYRLGSLCSGGNRPGSVNNDSHSRSGESMTKEREYAGSEDESS